jgi:twitching motility protein PilT
MPSAPAAGSVFSQVVAEAIRQEAADIILSFNVSPCLKVNGTLERLDQFAPLSDADLKAVIGEIVPASKTQELADNRQVDLAYAQEGARFRVNVFYQRGHLSVVMRYIRSRIRTMEELGLPEILRDLLGNDNGLILMVGPTGSGKSTSLAAMIEHINANEAKHIITIEDPIEYIYDNKKSVIQQRELGVDAMSFAAALRSALREAPDVILMGEMRDLESISTAITVAETGHLVLSTIHANTAPGTVDRIIDIFPDGAKDQIRVQLADILVAVLNQRLVPKADGSGSMAIIEVMLANTAVKNAIRTANTAQLPNVIQTASAEGMHLLDDLLLKSARHGDITKDVALEYANDRTEMRKSLLAA